MTNQSLGKDYLLRSRKRLRVLEVLIEEKAGPTSFANRRRLSNFALKDFSVVIISRFPGFTM